MRQTMTRPIAAALVLGSACLLAAWAHAQELRAPASAIANQPVFLGTGGSGSATFYLFGPASALKRDVKLGEDIELKPEDLRAAGHYTTILRDGSRSTMKGFTVIAAQPAALNFLARPSRVPVDRPGVISGVAFVFDDNKNLALSSTDVKFSLSVEGAPSISRNVEAHDGIAWTKLDSSRHAGAAQFVATVGSTEVRRVVQQTASDPCNLRFRTTPSKSGVTVETDPVRDCTGNPVPDGTIVTFTETAGSDRSTIDARIKRGVARADLPGTPGATISVASGVVLGNEIRLGGSR